MQNFNNIHIQLFVCLFLCKLLKQFRKQIITFKVMRKNVKNHKNKTTKVTE